MSRPILLLAAPILWSGCAAGPYLVREEHYDREIEQVGVAPGPSGVHAVGPLTPEGKWSLEGEVSATPVAPARESRAQGAAGVFLASDWARARVAHGLSQGVEAGFEVEGSPLNLVRPLATDLGDAEASGVVGRAGPTLRVRTLRETGMYAGAQIEASGTFLPYNHMETLTHTVTDYQQGLPAAGYSEDQWFEKASAVFFLTARGGFSLGYSWPGGADLSMVWSLESLPSFYGFYSASWGCRYYSDHSSECDDEPRRPVDTQPIFVGTTAAVLSLPLGHSPLSLLGSLGVHQVPRTGHHGGLELAPLTGTLGLRLGPPPPKQ